MRTWRHARKGETCGSCRIEIKAADPLLVIAVAGAPMKRCRACAKRMFGEDPPEEFPEDERVTVPAPSLLVDMIRQPDCRGIGRASYGNART